MQLGSFISQKQKTMPVEERSYALPQGDWVRGDERRNAGVR
jgi:hypothetical protein